MGMEPAGQGLMPTPPMPRKNRNCPLPFIRVGGQQVQDFTSHGIRSVGSCRLGEGQRHGAAVFFALENPFHGGAQALHHFIIREQDRTTAVHDAEGVLRLVASATCGEGTSKVGLPTRDTLRWTRTARLAITVAAS